MTQIFSVVHESLMQQAQISVIYFFLLFHIFKLIKYQPHRLLQLLKFLGKHAFHTFLAKAKVTKTSQSKPTLFIPNGPITKEYSSISIPTITRLPQLEVGTTLEFITL